MSEVRSIEKLTGGRYLVTLEDGMAFPLYGKELAGYGVREGEELSAAGYEEILHGVLPKRARRKALELLRSMDRTEAQLRRKLSDARYPDEIVEDAVAYVKSYHYVDDVRYAASYLAHHRSDRSLRQMEQTLYQRGITREVFAQAAALTDPVSEEQQILAWAKKRGFCPQEADQKEKERFFRFLLRKGYGISAIQNVIREPDLYE